MSNKVNFMVFNNNKIIYMGVLFIALVGFIAFNMYYSSNPEPSKFPVAVDSKMVGRYPTLVNSGAGYVYDDVLEYRVWFDTDEDDYYVAFPTYEEALAYSDKKKGADKPLVLVLQHEHINESETGVFEHVYGDRITEWQVEWLEGSKRGPNTIDEFLRMKSE